MGRRVLRGLCVSALILSFPASAAVWHVDVDRNVADADGTSWDRAFSTIQPAIDAASPGDEIWVARGVYDEERPRYIDVPPVQAGSIVLKTGVSLYGGFNGTEGSRAQRSTNPNLTVLDGAVARNGQPAYHVAVGWDFLEPVTIDGFTIRNGEARAENWPLEFRPLGAGLRVENCQSLTIQNCVFSDNFATQRGGGLFASHSSVRVVDCVFTNNESQNGGGISMDGGELYVSGCEFRENIATNWGAGIQVSYVESKTIIQHSVFEENFAPSQGLAIYASGALVIDGSVIRNNIADLPNKGWSYGRSGAIVLRDAHDVLIRNTIIAGNHIRADEDSTFAGAISVGYYPQFPDEYGITQLRIQHCTFYDNDKLAIRTELPAAVEILNTIFWGHSHGVIQNIDGTETVAGSLLNDVDPKFTDAEGGDFSLQAGSPANGAGVENTIVAFDITGAPRPQGSGGPEAGAYENPGAASDSDGDGILDAFEGNGDADDDGTPNRLDDDSDGDGVSDQVEGAADFDYDDIPNFLDTDADGDGIDDSEEVAQATDPFDRDSDGDTMPDGWEVENGFIPSVPDGHLDADGDTVPNARERLIETDPRDGSDPRSKLYVALNGDDDVGTGELQSPWGTIEHAMLEASAYSVYRAVSIYLGSGTYDQGAIQMAYNVALEGAGQSETTIQHFDDRNPSGAVIEAEPYSKLKHLTVTLPRTVQDTVSLVRAARGGVELENVVLDGKFSPNATAIFVTGLSDDIVAECSNSTIRRVDTAIWSVDANFVVSRNLFRQITGRTIFIVPPEFAKGAGAGSAPLVLGSRGRLGDTGLNRFRDISPTALLVNNASESLADAAYNDWGYYSTESIANRTFGTIDTSIFFTHPIAENSVYVEVLDAADGQPLDDSLNPTVTAEGGSLIAARDPGTSLFVFQNVSGESITVAVEADERMRSTKVVPIGSTGIGGITVVMRSEGDFDIDGSGAVDAADIQVAINGALGLPVNFEADLDGNGVINAIDIQIIINAVLGIS